MSEIIKELLATNIETKEKISLTSNIKIYNLYENGEYEKYLNELSTLIESEKTIDIYSLFIAFNAEFILNLNDNALHTIFDNYISFIINSFDLLSPSDIKQNKNLGERGINSFLTFTESNIQNNINELTKNLEIEFDKIIQNISDLLAFLEAKEIKYNDHTKLELFNTLNRLQKIREKKQQELAATKKEEDAPEQEIDNNEQTTKENFSIPKEASLSNSSRNGSYKWEQLVNKIEILKQLIANDRLLESAIAYEDIEALLTNFDPKEYFPEVLFPYYKKIAPVASKIYVCKDQFANSVEWKIAKEMYQTDFRSFLSELDRMSENDQIDNLNGQPQLYNHNSDFNSSNTHQNYEDHNEMYRNDNY